MNHPNNLQLGYWLKRLPKDRKLQNQTRIALALLGLQVLRLGAGSSMCEIANVAWVSTRSVKNLLDPLLTRGFLEVDDESQVTRITISKKNGFRIQRVVISLPRNLMMHRTHITKASGAPAQLYRLKIAGDPLHLNLDGSKTEDRFLSIRSTLTNLSTSQLKSLLTIITEIATQIAHNLLTDYSEYLKGIDLYRTQRVLSLKREQGLEVIRSISSEQETVPAINELISLIPTSGILSSMRVS